MVRFHGRIYAQTLMTGFPNWDVMRVWFSRDYGDRRPQPHSRVTNRRVTAAYARGDSSHQVQEQMYHSSSGIDCTKDPFEREPTNEKGRSKFLSKRSQNQDPKVLGTPTLNCGLPVAGKQKRLEP
ncbi:hypothetical protein K438DRAFT_1761341 [Mycena galopus ATCC 62051]|nr:hypothetical protein K438DRAFT_1761341 [Mycena galopus ATCC 62051]